IQLVLNNEQHRPNLEAIAGTDALSFRDRLAIQPGAVDAAKVLDGEEALDQFKAAVLAADGGRGNPQPGALLAPGQPFWRAHSGRVPAACPTLHHQPNFHNALPETRNDERERGTAERPLPFLVPRSPFCVQRVTVRRRPG